MDYQRFDNKIIARFDPDEEILAGLKTICEKENIMLAEVKALGALKKFCVGLFNTNTKEYHSTEYEMPVEITSLWGTVTTKEGEIYVHVHMSAGDSENRVYGGHLNSAVVSATCEMIIDVIDGTVERKFSPTIGLNLFQFNHMISNKTC